MPVLRSGVCSFAVSKRGVGGNFIIVIVCGWVHKCCSTMMARLNNVIDFICAVCNSNQTLDPSVEIMEIIDTY